jgi:hypothetical protein
VRAGKEKRYKEGGNQQNKGRREVGKWYGGSRERREKGRNQRR